MKTPYLAYQIPNLASGLEFSQPVVGNYIILLSYTGTDTPYISFDDESFQLFPVGVAVKLPEGDEFKKIKFKQTSGAAQTFLFATTNGQIFNTKLLFDNAYALSVNAASNSVESPAAANVTATAAVAVAADSSVREVILQNTGSNDIWIGDSAIDPSANRGKLLEVGMECVWSCSGDIYARCAAGLTSTLSIVKLKKV